MRVKRVLALGERRFANGVKYDVVCLGGPGEILPCIVDHPIGPDRCHEREVDGAAHPGHVGAEVLGQLHRSTSQGAGCADNQHSFTRPDLRHVPKETERGGAREASRGGFLKTEIGRL